MDVQWFVRQKSYTYGLQHYDAPKEHHDDNGNNLSPIIFKQSAYIFSEKSV